MKRTYSVTVRARDGAEYAFTFTGDSAHLAGWRAAGLQISEVCNTVPMWVQRLGLTRAWCGAQDAWAWLRLW